MDEDTNTRYKIADIPLEGEIAEMGSITNWGDNGRLREVVLRVEGLYGPAFVPTTVFGDDASYLDPARDTGKNMKCTARLTSKRYTDRNGKLRWSVSMSARGIVVSEPGPLKSAEAKAMVKAVDALESDMDDIPF
jgi:hypothetical protein